MSALMEVQVSSPVAKAETKVLAWVFDKFVGGAFSQAGGFAMDQALSLIGLKDETQELNNRLDKIQQGIDEILREIKAIRTQLDGLLRQLKLSTDEIVIAIGENVIAPARASIDAHFGSAETLLAGDSNGATVTSLGEALRLRRRQQDVDTTAFARSVIDSWDIEKNVILIAQVAGEETDLVTKPLLRGWTDYLIEKNRGATAANALTMYLTLESYFQRLLETQFKGIALVAAAKANGKTEAQAKPITEECLAGFAPHIAAEADLFVRCADEIILAILADPPTRWLYSPGPTTVTDPIATISRRANLMRSIVRAAVGKDSRTTGGIYGTVIGRNVDKENAALRTFTPKGYDASAGDAIGPLDAGTGNAPIEWERTNDKKYAQLRPKSKSAFRAFHYRWPWKGAEPEAGKAIDPSFDGGLAPQRYSLDTLEKTDDPKEPSVLVADFCQMRCVEGAVFADPAAADGAVVSVPEGNGTSNVNQNRSGYRSNESHGPHPLRANETLLRPLARGTLEAHMNYHTPQGDPVGYRLEFPLFRYTGEAATIELVCERSFVLELYDNVYPMQKRDGYAYMYMTPQATIALSRFRKGQPATKIPLYDTEKEHSLWQQGTGARSADQSLFRADVNLYDTGSAEDLYSLILDFGVRNELHTWGTATDPGGWAKGRIQYQLSGFRVAWK